MRFTYFLVGLIFTLICIQPFRAVNNGVSQDDSSRIYLSRPLQLLQPFLEESLPMIHLEESKEMDSNPERSASSNKEQLQLKKIVQDSESVIFENTTIVPDIVDKINETMEVRRAKPLCNININDSVISVLLDACT